MNKVFTLLKTKASSFGFNKSELMGVAEQISNNHEFTDESSEDEINAAIDAVLPFLKVGQQQAQRIATKKDAQSDPKNHGGQGEPNPDEPKPHNNPNDEPEWFRRYREAQDARLARLEGEKTESERLARLSTLVEGTGAYGKSVLSHMKRMSFKDEDDFEAWFSEVSETVDEMKQEGGNEALGRNAKPKGGSSGQAKVQATDAEIAELVAKM